MSEKALFHRAHYNILAAQFRERLEELYPGHGTVRDHMGVIELGTFAVQLAKRLKRDNSRFDPVKFLNACSPHESLPLADLWKDPE